MAISPNGSLVGVGSGNGTVYLWDLGAGQANANPSTTLHDPGGKNVYYGHRGRRVRLEHEMAGLSQRANSVARDSRTTVTRIWPG